MKLSFRSSLGDVALLVGNTLRRRGIKAVLTGGACAHVRSGGAYASHDVDFVLDTLPTQRKLDEAMAELGFRRRGDQYTHPDVDFTVEFPRGPLAIGTDHSIRAVLFKKGSWTIHALSATDSCRDRLAAFYHWNDRQALVAAIAIAQASRVRMQVIREWSDKESAAQEFEEFRRAVERARQSSRRHR